MPLKEQIAVRRAQEPEYFTCVEMTDRDRERPVGVAFWPWDALPVVLPWIRFEGAFFVGEADGPELVLAFAGHRIVVQGSDLGELVIPLREQRVKGLHALPHGYTTDKRREATWITALNVEEAAGSLDGQSVTPALPESADGEFRVTARLLRGIASFRTR